MLSALTVILPIFSLIMAGWIAHQTKLLGPQAMGELNRFVIHLALPALLFDIVANANWTALWQPAFVATFGLSTGVIFTIALIYATLRSKRLPDAAIDGLNASYANAGFIGIPLAFAVLGPPSMIPALIATILTVCVLFAIAIVIVEIGLQSEKQLWLMILKITARLVRNPLLVAPILGTVFMLLEVKVPTPAESFLKLLGGAASPCALVALGLFLAQQRHGLLKPLNGLGIIILLKLIAHPLVTWFLATKVFHLSEPMTQCATLLAALPTGTGPFMVAQYYQREGGLTSSAILLSTVLSLLTITGYLMLE